MFTLSINPTKYSFVIRPVILNGRWALMAYFIPFCIIKINLHSILIIVKNLSIFEILKKTSVYISEIILKILSILGISIES